MDLYFNRHDGQAATVDDFVQCFADARGRDLTQFMRWYAQAGTPEIMVAPHLRCRGTHLSLDIAQTAAADARPAEKEPMVIPLALGLVGNDGGDLPLVLDGRPLDRGVHRVDRSANQSFVFTGIAERPVPSLNRAFSAPVKLSLPIDADDLRFLAAHDCDPFNRWQAVQTLAMSLLKEQCRGAARGQSRRATTTA